MLTIRHPLHDYVRRHADVGFPSRLLTFFSPPNCIGCLNQRVSCSSQKAESEREREPHGGPPFCISKAQFKEYVKSPPLCSMCTYPSRIPVRLEFRLWPGHCAHARARARPLPPLHPRRGIRIGCGGHFWRISMSLRAETKIDSRDGHETG